jgi:aldehyde dehydrogenase (NAD+)
VYGAGGRPVGEVGQGNRKDIRNAVEAAHAASSWASATGHNRAQILYYIAENLSVRSEEFARQIRLMTARSEDDAAREVQTSIERLFTYAAWADKYDGMVHRTPLRNVTLAMPEPIGVTALVCPEEYPLLGFVSLVAPAISMGNTVVAVPSESYPLSATDFYQVLETSDVPAGVVNIVTGPRDTLTRVLTEHDDVDAIWYFGSAEGSRDVEYLSASNMKRTWVNYGHPRDWLDKVQAEGQEFLREATQLKNIWTPYGE